MVHIAKAIWIKYWSRDPGAGCKNVTRRRNRKDRNMCRINGACHEEGNLFDISRKRDFLKLTKHKVAPPLKALVCLVDSEISEACDFVLSSG